MPEPILLEVRDVTAALLRDRGITSGHWALAVEFGLAATYIAAKGTTEGTVTSLPAAIVPVQKIGLRQHDEPTNATVDASELSARRVKAKPKKQRKTPRP
jgi:hypothetical protein